MWKIENATKHKNRIFDDERGRLGNAEAAIFDLENKQKQFFSVGGGQHSTMLPDPVAPGLIPNIPQKISFKKMSSLQR